MTGSDRTSRANSFGAVAEAYERGRPGYPADAIDWLLPNDAECILDLGAGTGKLTRLLGARVPHVIAVEPSTEMLDALRSVVSGIDARDGTAENLPIGDDVVDAVVCAQTWHWVDPVLASREIGRVLRPEGTLGLVWNFRDRRVPWVAELDRILDESNTANTIGTPDVQSPFGALERFETSWVDTLSRPMFKDLIRSRSFMITADETRRRQVLADVDTLLENQGETIALPYVTVAFRARRA